MKQGRHRSDRETPLEAQQYVDEDGAKRDQHRKAPLLGKLFADQRAREINLSNRTLFSSSDVLSLLLSNSSVHSSVSTGVFSS